MPMSEQSRQKLRDLLAERRKSPEFKAKQRDGIKTAMARIGADPAAVEAISQAQKKAALVAWARRRANGTDKIILTPEQKRERAERLAATLANPDVEARRKARVQEVMPRVYRSPGFRGAVKAGLLKAFAENPEYREMAGANSRKNWTCPEFRERKIASIIESKQFRAGLTAMKTPESVRKMKAAAKIAQDNKRGFRIPYALREEYKRLTTTKKLSAAEAGKMLGLI